MGNKGGVGGSGLSIPGLSGNQSAFLLGGPLGLALNQGVKSSKEYVDGQKNAAQAAANAQQKAIEEQQQAYKDQIAKQEQADAVEKGNAEASANQRTAKQKQRAAAAGASGRSDTILTSPLGILGGPQGQSKTLLGS